MKTNIFLNVFKRRYWAPAIGLALFWGTGPTGRCAGPDAAVPVEADRFVAASRQIWQWAELGYKETRSAGLLEKELKASGFSIKDGVVGIPTAFVAEYGSGKPVIGILAEYDALPKMGQPAAPVREMGEKTANGHACGHNLLGTGSALAAVAIKDWLSTTHTKGTIRLYGCPAEEGGGGKNYMVRAGLFSDCDAVLAWHPADYNAASLQSNMANISAKIRFKGVAAHAALKPEDGRSALDALMVATHAIELLREHVPDSTRIHYVITHGGSAPNIVPDFSEIYLYVRSPDTATLGQVWERVQACAKAGALATGTQTEIRIVNSNANILPNDTLAGLLDKHLRSLGGIVYTPEEISFAKKMRPTLTGNDLPPVGSERDIRPVEEGCLKASSDVGDVSWAVPMSEFHTACWIPGTPAHSWQAVACSGTGIGEKGMLLAARVLALTAADIYLNPQLAKEARASFQKRSAGKTFKSFLPADYKPPLGYRD